MGLCEHEQEGGQQAPTAQGLYGVVLFPIIVQKSQLVSLSKVTGDETGCAIHPVFHRCLLS